MRDRKETRKRREALKRAANKVVIDALAFQPLGLGQHTGPWLVTNDDMRNLQAALVALVTWEE